LFVESYKRLKAMEAPKRLGSVTPTQAAYVAAGLVEWDQHVTGRLSAEATLALELMFECQSEDGSWGNQPCWPPFESDAYQGTTVALMAAAAAPEWLKAVDEKTKARFEKGKRYLLDPGPPHDYGRLLLLWTATLIPDLLAADLLAERGEREKLIKMVFNHQRPDGGWSIRTFARPEEWGDGSRAEKLRGETDFDSPPSDGHMTGLAILVLREAGIDADDERIQKGTRWLLANQRASGRWWTRSLNTDSWHFITYSGTLYPLIALEKCGLLADYKRL
jgi:squalene-hopene/tetraprenyl-beta-curcumene cyclase